MSQSDIKPIKINPELFNLRSKTIKNKTLKKQKPSNANIQPNKLKSDLLAKIKNYKYNKYKKTDLEKTDNSQQNIDEMQQNQPEFVVTKSELPVTKSELPVTKSSGTKQISSFLNTNVEDEFTASLDFLKELSSRKKKLDKTGLDNLPINNNQHEWDKDFNTELHKSNNNINSSEPQYGCLRNGNLPTYREWKNKTLKKYSDTTDNDDSNNIGNESSNFVTNNTADNNSNINNLTISESSNKDNRHNKTLKYYLGKRGKKVSIMVKNAATRKKISSEHLLLKQTKLSDMKSYLKRHNLLKSGSYAPSDVIRKLYEQTLLSGEVRNSNNNNYIHNYLAQ